MQRVRMRLQPVSRAAVLGCADPITPPRGETSALHKFGAHSATLGRIRTRQQLRGLLRDASLATSNAAYLPSTPEIRLCSSVSFSSSFYLTFWLAGSSRPGVDAGFGRTLRPGIAGLFDTWRYGPPSSLIVVKNELHWHFFQCVGSTTHSRRSQCTHFSYPVVVPTEWQVNDDLA